MKWMTVKQVAPEVGMSEQALYDAIRKGIFPAIRIGRRLRIDEGVLQEWAERGGENDAEHLRRPSSSKDKHN